MFNPKLYQRIDVEIINHKDEIKPVVLPPVIIKNVCVVISAYDAAEFIEECLDSIQVQTYKNFRILLGIDGCKKTLNKVKEIMGKYENLQVYYSKKNNGVYMMFNALSELVDDNEYIQFFGADDVMHPDMLEKMVKHEVAISRHVGVLFIQAKELRKAGGFRPWRCAADADMVLRLRMIRHKREKIEEIHYYRRIHPKQLTAVGTKTGNGSKLREEYHRITEENYKSETPVTYINPKKSKLKKL